MLLENLKDRIKQKTGLETEFSQPPSHVQADLALSTPLSWAKIAKRNPLELAQELAQHLESLPELARVHITPPGFLNLTLSPQALWGNLHSLFNQPESYGRHSQPPPEKWMIEFVSANPTGPLHVGHGRGAALGDSLTRIMRHLGYSVHREYYVNDVGNQVQKYGESLAYSYGEFRGWSVPPPKEWSRWPSAFPPDGYPGEDVLETARSLLRPLPSLADYTRHGIEHRLKIIQKDLEDFGVTFDEWVKESTFHQKNKVNAVLEELKHRGKAHEKEGTLWFGSQDSEEDKERVLVRSDGRPTYFASDIAYHQNKFERGFSRLIDVWGADHHKTSSWCSIRWSTSPVEGNRSPCPKDPGP